VSCIRARSNRKPGLAPGRIAASSLLPSTGCRTFAGDTSETMAHSSVIYGVPDHGSPRAEAACKVILIDLWLARQGTPNLPRCAVEEKSV
jgi:hypothetical protein